MGVEIHDTETGKTWTSEAANGKTQRALMLLPSETVWVCLGRTFVRPTSREHLARLIEEGGFIALAEAPAC